ncbi:DUF5590 domain-containing protein [Paenibacillus sp. MZ04-78.2]|uniref:cell wall elongation regulator TseB-like domain-containing protein n=1 Tax=Paenibacillus sp. MZ04-78.2 TaxID=2962034 RepID=UPI0020B80C93|nr:DUF5590 domain-containing protein [Paenibacillus sp. MZ04-78.2]MCP3772405.1 DUF5590 domain-containing protein [Paenibacillus sp. MZ04-78.2]
MRKAWKITIIAGTAAVVIVTGMIMAFNSIMDKEWTEQRAAILAAYEKTILTKAMKVERFVAEKSYTVITGEDKIGQPIYVWVGQDEMHTEMGSSGIDAAQAEAKVRTAHPEAKVLRTTPGIRSGQLVWEVFYKLQPEGKIEQHFYDYYTFKDGQAIDTLRLTIQ